ncbi:hypothetical protein CU102_05520 [Phyllobacterium brassicacearum]|uniref:RDD domain-containing protein n=1 Tax=Phyllobacterium brassicacearum TaxID=314235 RepID=A0A2P7BTC3_9HYPH|nr:RDD family protein [Phyllobacterium brassicacearum]PSH69733.1 hypothetical protein CU102_05520 [Phyllobacterium brassicacearum]TDQ34877.1 RDD family protein [Phyllobacterium brassicacearum]
MVDGADVAAHVRFWDAVNRAGFWRRVLAFLIDATIVLIPLQVLVAVLFAQTNGTVQGSFGFTTTYCVALGEIPANLEPAPPAGFNSAAECRISFIGFFDTARTLSVAKVTEDGSVTTSISTDYTLGTDGQPNQAFTTDWIALLLLLAYLVVMEYRFGRTFGKQMLGIRTIDTDDPAQTGIPLKKAFFRQLAMWIGATPALLLLSYLTVAPYLTSGVVAAMILTWLIGMVWLIWIIVSVSKKQDPIYDRLVGTAVVSV